MASQTITGQDLQFTQDNRSCYAFSGTFEAKNSTQTLFDFTAGSGYIVATLTMTAPIKMASIASGNPRGYQLDFNSKTVGLYKVDSGEEDMPTDTQVKILIPPFTAVVLTCIDNNNDSDFLGTANITGRVYEHLPVRN